MNTFSTLAPSVMRPDTGVCQPLVSYRENVSPLYILYHVLWGLFTAIRCCSRAISPVAVCRVRQAAPDSTRSRFFRLETQDSVAACIEL